MKKLQQFCGVTTLLFVLSLPALAGNIHTNVVEPPPPPPSTSATATMSNNLIIPTQCPVESEILITEIALSFLQLLAVI